MLPNKEAKVPCSDNVYVMVYFKYGHIVRSIVENSFVQKRQDSNSEEHNIRKDENFIVQS